jgi:drug/metabolite transporter (DMT)-like permease
VDAATVALILFAALLHASWNAVLRAGADRLWSMTMMGLVGAALAATLAVFLPSPAPASWPFMAVSSLLQVGYALLLVRAYRDGHLAHVYPLARGTAPLLVTLGGLVFLGQHPPPAALAGAGLVSAGILVLALGRDRPDRTTLGLALATGGFIASYMLIDGIGVRRSGNPIAYAAWLTAAQGLGMGLAFFALRRRGPALPRGREGVATCIAAVIGALAYGIALWAMGHAPVAEVSALRETSILFAVVLGTLLLREPVTVWRIIGGCSIAAGAVCISSA